MLFVCGLSWFYVPSVSYRSLQGVSLARNISEEHIGSISGPDADVDVKRTTTSDSRDKSSWDLNLVLGPCMQPLGTRFFPPLVSER